MLKITKFNFFVDSVVTFTCKEIVVIFGCFFRTFIDSFQIPGPNYKYFPILHRTVEIILLQNDLQQKVHENKTTRIEHACNCDTSNKNNINLNTILHR